jgi:hypothetical protein
MLWCSKAIPTKPGQPCTGKQQMSAIELADLPHCLHCPHVSAKTLAGSWIVSSDMRWQSLAASTLSSVLQRRLRLLAWITMIYTASTISLSRHSSSHHGRDQHSSIEDVSDWLDIAEPLPNAIFCKRSFRISCVWSPVCGLTSTCMAEKEASPQQSRMQAYKLPRWLCTYNRLCQCHHICKPTSFWPDCTTLSIAPLLIRITSAAPSIGLNGRSRHTY